MDLEAIKDAMAKKVLHVPSEMKVPLHKHDTQDEIFYCIKGSGFGVLEDGEVELTPGKIFLAPAGVMHSLRSDTEIYAASFLVPAVANL